MRLLIGLTKVWKHLFKKEKAPKATNEMKPVQMDKYITGIGQINTTKLKPEGYSIFENGTFISDNDLITLYDKVKNSWKRSPKNYNIWMSRDNKPKLVKVDIYSKDSALIGNLYGLYQHYQQYYGQKDNN